MKNNIGLISLLIGFFFFFFFFFEKFIVDRVNVIFLCSFYIKECDIF
jgi:hypothetical protein